MKKLRYITVCVLLTALACGCNKDFLDRVPQDQISAPAFWKTPNDLQLYVNNLYDRLGKNSFTLQDGGSDNALLSNYKSDRMLGQVLSTTDAIGDEYTYIRRVNIMITNMDRVTDPDGDQYKGEAYYFRAFHYFNVLQRVGAAQIVKEPLNAGDKKLYEVLRSPRNLVADFILSDLDKAISLLKTKSELRTSNQEQRITKDAALAFKSRVALYEGSWEKYHNGTPFGVPDADYNKYFTAAAEAAKTLIDEFGYKLDDDYQSVFRHHELSGTPIASDEIIFARQFDHVKYNTNWAAAGEQMNTWPHGGYTRSAIRSYLCTDGLPISVSSLYVGDTSLYNITKNRDPRLAMTIYTPGELWRVSGTGDSSWFPDPFLGPNGGTFVTGYVSQKFYIPDVFETPGQNRLTWDHITIYFRYGEVLLNYAEAKAELGQLDQAAADISINQLRSRPSVQMVPLTVGSIVTDPDWPDWGYPLSPLLQEVRRERRIELLGENFRFDDLMRWAAAKLITGQNYRGGYYGPVLKQMPKMTDKLRDADNYLQPFKDFLPEGYQFDPNRDYLLPFPVDEIILNPKLTQNPGW